MYQSQYQEEEEEDQIQDNNNSITPQGQDDDDNPASLSVDQRLALAERANEIYRQQIKYMQDQLANLRSVVQDRENIIENLMMRFDTNDLKKDANYKAELDSEEIDEAELRKKVEGLAQRTILENFDLREMMNELRDENFHLRNELYELQDKLNVQALQISRLTKTTPGNEIEVMGGGQFPLSNQNEPFLNDEDYQFGGNNINHNGMNIDMNSNGNNNNGVSDLVIPEDLNQSQDKHRRQRSRSISGVEWLQDNEEDRHRENKKKLSKSLNQGTKRRESKTMEDLSTEKRQSHKRDDSHPIPDLGFDDDLQDNSEEALRKRQERMQKRNRKESGPIPDIFDQNQDEPEESKNQIIQSKKRDSIKTGDTFGPSATQEEMEKRGMRMESHQRKDSGTIPRSVFDITTDMEPTHQLTQEELAKRKERQDKENNRRDSVPIPNLFDKEQDDDDETQNQSVHNKKDSIKQLDMFGPAMSKEAIEKRAERANKEYQKRESVEIPKVFGTGMQEISPSQQQKNEERSAHGRRESVPTPDLFQDKVDDSEAKRRGSKKIDPSELKNTPEAVAKRQEREARHEKKQSSQIIPQMFGLHEEEENENGDPEARNSRRRPSREILLKYAGEKGYFSDEEKDKPPKYEYEMKRQQKKTSRKKKSKHQKDPSLGALPSKDGNAPQHRRDSSAPIPNLGFDEEEVQEELNQLLQQMKNEKKVEEQKILEVQQKVTKLEAELTQTQKKLADVVHSKVKLVEVTSHEIEILRNVINSLMQHKQFKDVVTKLLQQSTNSIHTTPSQKHSSLLG